MRLSLPLQTAWSVSISPRDAALAAHADAWTPAELELADDPANHPQTIDLPGGWQYGLRPQMMAAESGRPDDVPVITQQFVGATQTAAGQRLPHPWLSYAKVVPIPAEATGHAVCLVLDNVRYHVTVRVNDIDVAHYVGGYEPHRIEITDAVVPGEKALILITVGDVGVSGHRPFDPFNYTGTRLPMCEEIKDNLVHPVQYGGFDGRQVEHVTLEVLPRVRTDYVLAIPQVAQGRLRYRLALSNATDQPVTVQLRSEAVGAKVLVEEPVTLPAQETTLLDREIPWPDAIRWDVDQPHLYDLLTTLTADGDLLDTHTDYFGFRDFTIDGHSFFLNGKKIHLHGNSGHVDGAQDAMSLDEKMRYLADLKTRCHLTHIRLHAKPQDPRWVEAADRVGMLLTTETALWTTGFHSFDWAGSEEACYQNVRAHFLEALVRRDRNRPSVVIWSLSNEMSPITPADLENPKMAAMTRVFDRILAETRAEDDSRIVQMSSAMDFLGRLAMYNLHYPKNWQAFPDYPHTAYWLDGSFLFPWYGPRRQEMPSWGWRKDKPLYFGEFTCVFGATPDNQASIVGDRAFEEPDGGTRLVQEKLWPLEVKAYRRRDVSGFCAWAFALGHATAVDELLTQADILAHTDAVRPLAVLDHTYRTQYLAGDEVARELSVHNDTREPRRLAVECAVVHDGETLWTETMPARAFGPAENLAFTCRYRAPQVAARQPLAFRVSLTAEGAVVDQWETALVIWPRLLEVSLPAGAAVLDPDGTLTARLAARGIGGVTRLATLDALTDLSPYQTLWLNFSDAKLRYDDWERGRERIARFVHDGGVVLLDGPPLDLPGVPMTLANGKGYAAGERLELTYAYPAAPHHPVLNGLTEKDFALWGADYYLAHRCLTVPQEGNALPLLVAGTDRLGLTSSPLLEIRYGRGSFLVNTLDLVGKLAEAPAASAVLCNLLTYQPTDAMQSTGVCVTDATLARLREVGFAGATTTVTEALRAEVALIDGDRLDATDIPQVAKALAAGQTVYLHALSVEGTRDLLAGLKLPGSVAPGALSHHELLTKAHPLTDGATHQNLYWTTGKAKLAAWTPATLHPDPATALITEMGDAGVPLTRHGAAVCYPVGAGRLIIDNLRWQLDELDEPERPRRYLVALLTNLGVPLTTGAEQRMSEEFETAEERRERGHF
jgi:hypothetical protein